jgi:hypothetical protein
LPKPKVAVYGQTTEGYSLASRLVEKASVTIVDETLQMAVEIEPSMVRTHHSLGDLVGDEMLMGLKPVSQVLSEASAILFTPKLKKSGEESVIESSTKLREVARYVSAGSTVVNFLPTGVGGNADNISLLEKQTGMKVGERLNYGYSPVAPRGEAGAIALHTKSDKFLALDGLGLKTSLGDIGLRELEYIRGVLSVSTAMAAEVELMHKSRDQRPGSAGEPERYVDDLASLVYDLTAIQASEDVGEPITYLASASIRSLENYGRYIVEETRELLRELQLKASRTKVVVAWSADRYEMRADRIATAESIVAKLRDYVTDVQRAERSGPEGVVDANKHSVVIACTSEDLEWFKGLKKSFRSSEITILKAGTSIRRA